MNVRGAIKEMRTRPQWDIPSRIDIALPEVVFGDSVTAAPGSVAGALAFHTNDHVIKTEPRMKKGFPEVRIFA
jgi:hypothetical protein